MKELDLIMDRTLDYFAEFVLLFVLVTIIYGIMDAVFTLTLQKSRMPQI